MPRDVDFNLLKALQALLEERSVTRAAERLGVSQPAMSVALGKLRRHFGDPLLSRVGHDYHLTPLAVQLAERTAGAVAVADRVFSLQPEFDPTSASREFVVALSDYAIRMLGPVLSRRLAAEAPEVRVHLRQVTAELVDAAPESLRRIDAFVLPHGFLGDLPFHDLLDDTWDCLVATDNNTVGTELTVADLGRLPWVYVFHRPTAFTTAVRELRTHGIEPAVQLVCEHYGTLPSLIVGTDRIALVQHRLGVELAAGGVVRILPCPVPLAPLKLALWWHPANTPDAGHQWLRHMVIEAARVV